MTRCTYLLPIRRASFSPTEAAELAAYFRTLNDAGCDPQPQGTAVCNRRPNQRRFQIAAP